MTLNDLECLIQLKVRLMDGTLEIRLLRVSDFTDGFIVTSRHPDTCGILLIRSANTQHAQLDRPYELNNSNLPVVAAITEKKTWEDTIHDYLYHIIGGFILLVLTS